MKDCPDLAALTADQRREFWSQADPRELRRLGDRLLAESLPHVEPTCPREVLSLSSLQSRESAGWSREQLADVLGVSAHVLEAWETDQVRPPASLPLIVERLVALGVQPE